MKWTKALEYIIEFKGVATLNITDEALGGLD